MTNSTSTPAAQDSLDDFRDFIAASPSSFHAADEVARRLEHSGFTIHDEKDAWDAAPGGHVMVRGGAVMAWYVPEGAGAESAFRIVGAHTDSPGFSVKPNPDSTRSGWDQVAVEVYGGPIIRSWFDRELTLAGRVVTRDGRERLVSTGPIARIPNLAIHLERTNDFTPNLQEHLQPILSAHDASAPAFSPVRTALATAADLCPEDIVSFELITADTQHGEYFGPDGQFFAAGRMDNLSSVYAGMRAMERASASAAQTSDVLVLAAFDHEEVGSASRAGAAGPILEDVLTRTGTALGMDTEALRRSFTRSSCVSADAAHAVHPNYAAKHDAGHQPAIGLGPVTKINGKQRYATDAVTRARWESVCRDAGVPVQQFVGNNDVPCGSTIGPITATRLGIPTVDVGVPMLSMHSAREMIGVDDQLWLEHALAAYFGATDH